MPGGKLKQGAHNNAIEAFAPFAAGVFVAHLGGGNARHAAILSMAFIALRVVYLGVYLADVAAARSLVWLLGVGCVAGLMFLPLLR